MNTASVLAVLPLFFAASAQCGDVWYQRSGRTYENRVPITLANPLPLSRTQEPVVINLQEIAAKDFPGKSCVVVDPGAEPDSPCHVESGGNDTPSQVDDLDGDGRPDQLVFLATLAPSQKKTYYVYYTEKDVPPFVYPRRTQIVDFRRADANTLFAIESDVLAFRFNRTVPGAPAFVGDLLGKNRRFPGGYTLHLYDQKLPLWNYGNRPFHEYANLTPVGQCLLAPFDTPGQLGMGSILARQDGGWTMAQTGRVETRARMIVDGRIRSVGEIATLGWQVGNGIYDVTARCAMYAGQRYLQYDLEVTAKKGQGGQFAVGLMRLENERHDIQQQAGRLSLWGELPRINVRGVGLAMLFPPGNAEAIEEVPGGHVVALKGCPTKEKPLRATLYLSGGCLAQKRPLDPYWAAVCPDQANCLCGEFSSEREFFDLHGELARKTSAPIAVDVAARQSNTAQATRGQPTDHSLAPVLRGGGWGEGQGGKCRSHSSAAPFTGAELFLANPSNRPSVLPGELELGLLGFEPVVGVELDAKDAMAEVATLDGSSRIFVRKQVAPCAVEKMSLRVGTRGAKGGFRVEQASGAEGGLWVSSRKAWWLVTESGLRRVRVEDKELAVEQPGVSGTVKILHHGALALVVRVGDATQSTDYYFFQGTDIIRIAANHPLRFQSGQARSYVGKKELGVAGCERSEVCSWGRWSSDSVFDKVAVLYPAEWSALFAADRRLGLMCYGSPSAPEINVEKGGKLDSPLARGCQRQELYVTPIEEIAAAEDLFPMMSRPFVFVPHENGFACREDRNGNGVMDTVRVEDRNGNGMPDFDGDRWLFDTDSDDALQMVLEFESKPRQMKVFCDTVSGTSLHSNNLAAYFGGFPDKWYHAVSYPPSRHKFDGCLSPAELTQPFYVYESMGDGFFKGPVTEGGFIASGKVVALRGGPYLTVGFARQETLTSWDLDGDGDCDIYMQDGPDVTQNNGPAVCGKHDRYVNYCVFDLSDNNLEPVTVVNPYTGLAYHAHRYFSFLMQDNSKAFQGGYRDGDGPICGGQNWPQAGTWDIDNDGVAEAHIYHEMQQSLGIDLAKKRTRKDTWVNERWNLQRDIYHEKQAIPVNFAVLAPYSRAVLDGNPLNRDMRKSGQFEMRPLMLPVGTFPVSTFTDPHGNSVSVCADFLPDKWRGERLDCKAWPDGQWDYWPTNNWNSFIRKEHPFVAVYFWRPGLDNHSEHEGCWNSLHFSPFLRTEIASRETSPIYLYRSPFLSGLHCRGVTFGLQFMHDGEDHKIANDYLQARLKDGEKLAEYFGPRTWCNDYSRSTRLEGRMFLYYLDEDRDGYADTYLLDDDNDGYFEKRMWYDKEKGILSFYDGGMLGIAARRLEFPGHSLELKNYEKLVEMYRDSLAKPGLLRELRVRDGRCENASAVFSAVLGAGWLPRVAVDAVHAGGKDLWKDFSTAGLDTLGRVLSELPVEVKTLATTYSREALAKVDLLVLARLDSPMPVTEQQALDVYVNRGGMLLILTGDDASRGLQELAARFGVRIGNERSLSLIPGQCNSSEILGQTKEIGTYGLLPGVAPFFLEARKVEADANAKTVLECGGKPLIVQAASGIGRVLVVPSNMFANRFMCLPGELRKEPFKPGNQALAKNLMKHLLGGLYPRIDAMGCDYSQAHLRLRGRGGEIRLQVPWREVLVRVNGVDTQAEWMDGAVVIQVPQGSSRIELMR